MNREVSSQGRKRAPNLLRRWAEDWVWVWASVVAGRIHLQP
jgi:hypothetical protein